MDIKEVVFVVDDQEQILTKTERGYLPLLGEGLKRREMAALLHKEETTVDTHVKNIQQKLGAPNSASAVVKAIAMGILKVSMAVVVGMVGIGSEVDFEKARILTQRNSRRDQEIVA